MTPHLAKPNVHWIDSWRREKNISYNKNSTYYLSNFIRVETIPVCIHQMTTKAHICQI
jgi:hypothetical protein